MPSIRCRRQQANDLAVRWNCKAGKCGSCSAEVNGMPKLMCMTRMSDLPADKPVTIEPMRAFPHLKDLVTDVSWNYRVKKQIKPFLPGLQTPRMAPGGWTRGTSTGFRNSASASSASSARTCVTYCASITSTTSSSARGSWCTPPRWRCIRSTPRTVRAELKRAHGIGYCNITKCCTNVCPENITITDNAIIPLKERVVDELYDPLVKLVRLFRGKRET